jgi:hypothetical protein
MERKEGWKAALPIYFLCCPHCKLVSETYPAGYGRIRCHTPGCGFNTRVTTWPRVRDKILPSFVPLFILFFFVISAFAAGVAAHMFLVQ